MVYYIAIEYQNSIKIVHRIGFDNKKYNMKTLIWNFI